MVRRSRVHNAVPHPTRNQLYVRSHFIGRNRNPLVACTQ
ncbi:hypothetical protein Godav_009411 [Gossypium davidsonii]|uniref:Uncharacterized protein n=1 Tax=Gossypium davidsonii TaxID=34287 RepID=A0A7J8SDK9_GOSDV|nr:hypothetical protein [Gossypium davidsonii]